MSISDLRPGCVGLLFALVASGGGAYAQVSPLPDLPEIKGGYVLFTIGQHQLRLERAGTSTNRLPHYFSWKRDQPIIEEWQVLDGRLAYFAQNLDISTAEHGCREQRIAIWELSSEAPYPGEWYRTQFSQSQMSEVPSLREFFGPLKNGAALIGGRYFQLTDPALQMSNGAYPTTSCRDGGSCGISLEIKTRLFARFRYYPQFCGLNHLIETTVAIKERLESRYTRTSEK